MLLFPIELRTYDLYSVSLTCQQDSDHRTEHTTGLSHIAHGREHCTKCTPPLLDLQLNNLAIGITLCAHNERDH